MLCVLFSVPALAQTTTLTTTSTVQATVPHLGLNIGGLTNYGPQQLYKSLNYAGGGYIPGTYWGTTEECSSGTNTTTLWFNNIFNANGYPANWWVGATYVAMDRATGAVFGSGTITASTANTGTTGTTFTLGTPLSRACVPSSESPYTIGDVLIVRLNKTNALYTPNQVISGIDPACSYNTSDVDAASANTQQSLSCPAGKTASFGMDAVLANGTNTSNTIAGTYVPWINLNGSYTATFKAKCTGTGTASLGVSLARGGGTTYVPYSTVTLTCTNTAGSGWATYYANGSGISTTPSTFTASETGSQTSALYYNLTPASGTVLMQDVDVIEGSTLSGNTTIFRDAVVYELQKLKPGVLRFMDSTDWCSSVNDSIQPMGNQRWCGNSEYVNWLQGPSIPYGDRLSLCYFFGSDCWISVGILNNATDWATLINWLYTSGWISNFASAGHKIYLEDGNEAWNSGASGTLFQGNGPAYGGTLGPNMAAARGAAHFNGSVIKLVGDSWIAPAQGFSNYGWLYLSMTAAGCTNGTQVYCPDVVDNATYGLGYLANFDTTGSNVSTTGAPFLDEIAGIVNMESVTTAPSNWQYSPGSIYLNSAYAKSQYNLPTAVYEGNYNNTIDGTTATQLQLNQIDAGVGNALISVQQALIGCRDANVCINNFFVMNQPWYQYNDLNPPNTVNAFWGATRSLATGPGQTPGASNVDRPVLLAMEAANNAIGSNLNLMSSSQSGTPTYSYAGGQVQGGNDNILANAAVPQVNCIPYANAGQTQWTTICFNNDLQNSHQVSIAGPGAPTGSVTQTIFGGSTNSVTDNNENSYVGPSSIAPVVSYPTSTTTSGTTFTLPAASMVTLQYTTSGTGSATTPTFSPAGGTYSSTQTVTIANPNSGTTIACYTLDGSTPVTNGAGTACTHGTAVTTTLTISTTTTVKAVAGTSTLTDSSVNSATYTISAATAATPTFSIAAGTYVGSRSVTLATSTSGCTLVWNTTNAQSGGNLTGTSTTNPIYVATAETIYAQAQSCSGASNSAIASAAYAFTPSTWYVRADGGTRYSSNVTGGQCNGLYDAAYPGTGTNQNCAFNDFRYMWDDDSGSVGVGAWVLAGGDTVLIRGCHALSTQQNPSNPNCRIGWDINSGGGSTNKWCTAVGNQACYNPAIPAGTPAHHTRILGQCALAGNCNTGNVTNRGNLVQIFGGMGVNYTFNLQSTQYVDVQGIELTSHNGVCTHQGTPSYPRSCATNAPVDDYATSGFLLNNTSASILFQDVYIHGFNSSGVFGPIGGAITMTRVFDGFNASAGWQFDDGGDTPNASGSSIANSYVTMTGNGCYEQYPIVNTAFSAQSCYDDVSGGFGDAWSGQDSTLTSFTCDHCTVTNNTKDGFIGPHVAIGTLTVTSSYWAGNMGQQLKWDQTPSGIGLFQNNLVVGNCSRMTAALPGAAQNFNVSTGLGGSYLSDFCRAGGSTFGVLTQPSAVMNYNGNTVVGAWDTIFAYDCGPEPGGQGDCGSASLLWKDNNFLGYTHSGRSAPGLFYKTDSSVVFTSSYNNEYGISAGDTCGTNHITCTSPLLVSQPSQPFPSTEAGLDVFNPKTAGNSFYPTSGSPLIGAGTAISGMTSDYYLVARPASPTLGGVEYVATSPTSGVVISGTVIVGIP